MRSAIWAFMALFGLLATLSFVQAAVPATSTFSLQSTINNARQGADISYDAFGNQYYIRFDNNALANVILIANAAGTLYTGCSVSATFQNNLVVAHTANTRLAGMTYVADRNFPASFTNHWLYATTCVAAGCRLVRYTVKNVAVPTSDCPIDFSVAPVNIADIAGTVGGSAVTSAAFANTHVAMAANPVTGTVYIASASSGAAAGANFAYVFQTVPGAVNPVGGANAGALSGNFPATTFTVYRIAYDGARVGSMAVDTHGTLWVVENTLFSVWVVTPFSTLIRYPSEVSTSVGAESVWVKDSFSAGKYVSVAADRSGNVYFSTFTSISGGTQGFITTFPALALITGAAQPRNWAYFTTGSFFENTNVAGGPMVYDPYRGRLIVSTPGQWYNIALFTVQFDFTTAPTTLFDTTGATCLTESATCVRVPIMVSNTPTSFSLRVAAPSWPSSVAALPFAPNFLVTGATFSANPTFPSTLTSTTFGTSTQIGPATGSFLYTFTSAVTITSSGFAGAITVAPAYTGATSDVSFLFTSIPAFTVVMQGAIQATPVTSTSFPLSSATRLLAGLPTRYNLALSPSLVSGCTNPTVTFPNTDVGGGVVQHQYTIPPTSVVAGTNLVVNLGVATPSVTYTTLVTAQYNWVGTFGGTGSCNLAYGAARVPFYAVAVTTQASPALIITPINQLISDVTPVAAGFEVRMVPPPTLAGADNIAVTFRSVATSNANGPSVAAATVSPCAGAFNAAASLTATNCNGVTCAATGLTFTPNTAGCPLSASVSAFLVADVTGIPASLNTYFFWNAATQAPAQITTASAIVYTATAPLSIRLKWGTRPVPNPQIVAVGDVVGPFQIDYTGALISGCTFTTSFGGTFQVFPSTTNLVPPTASSAGWSTGPFTLGGGYVVFYRAPSPATSAMLQSAGNDIVVNTPAGVTYDASGALAVQIRFVPTFTTTTSIPSAPVVAGQLSLWAGNTVGTRNVVTMTWGGALINTNNVITIYGTSSIAGSTVAFAAVNAATFPTGGPPQVLTPTRAGVVDPTTGTCFAVGATCASFSVSGVTTNSISFVVYGAAPNEVINFWPVVSAVPASTPAGADSAFFSFVSFTAKAYGQVMFNSYPTQLSVLVPTYFGVTVTPPAVGGAAVPLSVFDTAGVTLAGTYAYCSDISCVSPITATPFDLRSAYTQTTSVIQYIPPLPITGGSCTGGGALPYPCALGLAPSFSFELDPSYAFAYTNDLSTRSVVTFSNSKFKLTVQNNPVLRGSIAVTYMNYDAANDATNPPIGVNNPAANPPTIFTYPLDNNVGGVSALPIPMVPGTGGAPAKPSMNFLAGTRYVIGVTMFPPPASGLTPSLTVNYVEDTVTATSTFSYNRPDATTLPIASSPPLNASFVNIFSAVVNDFTNNRVDGALRSLATPFHAADSMCQAQAQAAGRCFVGFFHWTVPTITSDAARNPRIVFTVSGPGSADYPTQSQTVKVSGWCGPSANLRDALQPVHYAVPSTINTVCTPALPVGTFLNVFQEWTDVVTPGPAPWSQPIFYPASAAFVPGTTTWTPPTGALATTGQFAASNVAGTWIQVFRAPIESAAVVVAPSSLVYTVTTTNTGITDRTTTFTAARSTFYTQVRYIAPVVGSYTVKVANANFPAGGCDIPAVGYIGDNPATRLPSVSATSNNFGQVCVFPPRVGNGPNFAVTVSDGLNVDTNTFTAAALVTGATSPGFTGGVSGPATQFPAGAPVGTPTKAGLTLQLTGAIDYNGFNFQWDLANAATNIAEFRLCSSPAAGAEAAAYTAGVLTTICAPNAYPSFPAGVNAPPAGTLLQYRQVATASSALATTYAVNRVPISVTMKFTARGMGADFNLAGVSPFHYVVGETYAIELRTASSLSSPAVSGLTVTLNDVCGVLNYPGGGAAPAPLPTPAAVPARGQFSSQTLYFSPGETTKTFFYTPREICAPITTGGTTVNWGTIITATVCTDVSPQCADGAATRFVNPTPVYVSTFGAVRVDGIPAYLPTGVASPSPITVTLNPPILPAGAVSPVISTLSIPDLRVTLSDRAPAGGVIGNGDSAGGSFILGQNTGASATLNFATAGVRQSASVSYVAPPNSFFVDNIVVAGGTNYMGVSTGISVVLSGTGAPLYRIVGAPSNVYNGLASVVTSNAVLSPTNTKDLWNVGTASTATFNLRIVPEAVAAEASIEGVYFNVVAGAALAQSTSQSLATVSDNISQFVGNSNVQPGQANNAINFNLPFVSGVPFGYFAAVPFNMSAVVVNVATTANTVFVNNNGWPNAKSAGGSAGGYILPNALSGYVSPVFFLTPGLNTFYVAAPKGNTAQSFVFGSVAGAGTTATDINKDANGDGIVYRFTIARDTITNFGLFVSANGYGTLPWSANLPRLQPQYVAGSTASLLSVAPGSGSAQTVFTANVENGVQSVGVVAQFYGALKARVSSNLNEFGQVLVNIPNNRIVDFPLVTPTNLPGITSSTTSITLLGGGLGPITINVVRPGKSLIFGSQFFSAGAAIASNVVDTPTGPCVARTATSFGLAVYPSSRASSNGLTIKGTYATAQAPTTPVPIAQAATTATTTWDIVPGVNYVSYATLTSTAIPVSALPLTLNLRAVYAADAPSEFTALINYQLNLCPQ